MCGVNALVPWVSALGSNFARVSGKSGAILAELKPKP